MKRVCIQIVVICITSLLVTGCGGSGSADLGAGGGGVTLGPNELPVAIAGSDQTVDEQTTVTISGTESYDRGNGSISGFSWKQIDGEAVDLNSPTSATTTLMTPVTTIVLTLTFELTVTDNGGGQSTDIVAITVNPVRHIPTADAGIDLIVEELNSETLQPTVVALEGSGVDNPVDGVDGTIIGYQWEQVGGIIVPLINADTELMTFQVPEVASTEILTFELTVLDDEGDIASDTVTVSINPHNTVANAGVDQTIEDVTDGEPTLVTLSGWSEADPEDLIGTVLYEWVQVPTSPNTEILPENSVILTPDPAVIRTPTFLPPNVDQSTDLTFMLTVTDHEGDSASDTVIITVVPKNTAPMADAGLSRFVNANSEVILDASDTRDIETANFTFFWEQDPDTMIEGMPTIVLDDPTIRMPRFIAPSLSYAVTATFLLTATDTHGASSTAKVNIAIIPSFAEITNDSGIVDCSSTTNGQDSDSGRDVAYGGCLVANNNIDGRHGFSFTKLGAGGLPVEQNAAEWSCVKDNITGLTWEVKTTDAGVQDMDNQYTWFKTMVDPVTGLRIANDTIGTSGDDTETYVDAIRDMNSSKGLCGIGGKEADPLIDYSVPKWRVPTAYELNTIADMNIPFPGIGIDLNFFPNTRRTVYWADNQDASDLTNSAWVSYFSQGFNWTFKMNHQLPVRLVYSAPAPAPAPVAAPSTLVVGLGAKTIYDSKTGLTWMRCSLGSTYTGNCLYTPKKYTWQEAIDAAENYVYEGKDDWRLPNIKELSSITDKSNVNPAIDIAAFPTTVFNDPNTDDESCEQNNPLDLNDRSETCLYWSSSPYVDDSTSAWGVNFANGTTYSGNGGSNYPAPNNKNNKHEVRLVRGGQ